VSGGPLAREERRHLSSSDLYVQSELGRVMLADERVQAGARRCQRERHRGRAGEAEPLQGTIGRDGVTRQPVDRRCREARDHLLDQRGNRIEGGGHHRRDHHGHRRIGPGREDQLAGRRQVVESRPLERELGLEKRRLPLQGPVQVEAADVEHGRDGHLGHVRAPDLSHPVDGADPSFQRSELLRADEVRLVEHDHVAKGDLLAGLGRLVEV
jgi:hypothetical protein